jgi:23S rRNA (uridine2479-2'-O)-methyltransferase
LAVARRVSTRNATFQRWQTLLTNRTKRLRAGEFVVQGVRPISMAVEHGWEFRDLLADDRAKLSPWAAGIWRITEATRYVVSSDLMAELGEKSEGPPEMLAVVAMPPDDTRRLPVHGNPLVAVFDRPTSPGNIGSMMRSLDAFGGAALMVTGHAADPYDPKSVRASTGSIFSVPTVRVPSHREVLAWAEGKPFMIAGADETGDTEISDFDLTGPIVVVIGNETTGLTTAWRASCERIVRIPMVGTASSLNAASAATVIFYEALRQRATRAENEGRRPADEKVGTAGAGVSGSTPRPGS